ncbi:MAG: hypothetical protein KAU17_04870 [Spirochaetales bacterium]|nr:hypothetical protein [Spirochaetales bacterium]
MKLFTSMALSMFTRWAEGRESNAGLRWIPDRHGFINNIKKPYQNNTFTRLHT